MDSGLQLVLRFENQSSDYAEGFEAGQLWAKMELGSPIYKQTIHASNLKQVQEMAIAKDYVLEQFSMMEETGTWIEISAHSSNPKLPYWRVALWAILQPVAGAWTILQTFGDTATMVWRNRR